MRHLSKGAVSTGLYPSDLQNDGVRLVTSAIHQRSVSF